MLAHGRSLCWWIDAHKVANLGAARRGESPVRHPADWGLRPPTRCSSAPLDSVRPPSAVGT